MLLNLLKKYFYLYDHAQRSKGIQFIQKEKKTIIKEEKTQHNNIIDFYEIVGAK